MAQDKKKTLTKKPHRYIGKFNDLTVYSTRSQRIANAVKWNQSISLANNQYRKITWGDYSGYFLRDLPFKYLVRALENANNEFKIYLETELQRRKPKGSYT